jgi:CheY-like chemotaxis protein
MLAHELRNPLAPIRSAGEILSRIVTGDARAHAAVATIARQVTHLARLVDDLLDVSRITQGRIELRRRAVAIAEVISRALETVDPLLQSKRHRVAVVSGRGKLTVNGDPERLVQCVANVLANAAKYTDSEGEIRVETCAEEGSAVITVTDNGVGMSPDLLPRVFDLFVQADRSLDRAQGGLGIGLSIVKRLIEMHGGNVVAQSEGVGRGSTFQVRLPLLHSPDPIVALPETDAKLRRRIMVVDDNEDGANSLAIVLQLEGHEVLAVSSGVQALEKVGTFAPDFVLLDIGLPGLDGYQVAQRLRAIPDLSPFRLIAITGYGQDADRKRTAAAGFAGHLVKPIDFEVLRAMLGAGL